ncbi:hypothetical protein FRC07_014332 [Ceratobasidium sp. 392]|nr:hypothetical protein FRC07_014332 [Ceratobasidium sp. 392]
MISLIPAALGLLATGASASVIDARADPVTAAACPDTSKSQYVGRLKIDYIIVGTGAGGGPLAARLALNGYKVLALDAGYDTYENNVTIPLYFGRSNEDEKVVLDYYTDHYANGSKVNTWYPRAQGIGTKSSQIALLARCSDIQPGGSTIHNALIHMRSQDWDFDNIAAKTNDASWKAASMKQYFTRLEKNLYVAPTTGRAQGYGYDGWLKTDYAPMNLLTDPKYKDPQIGSIMDTIINSTAAVQGSDFNNAANDGLEGAGAVTYTKDEYHNRSSVRDHLVDVRAKLPKQLTIKTQTLATKILTCKNAKGEIQAYGVQAASGPHLLPVAREFTGKTKLVTTTYTAKYEIISSAGTFQTPQLLMLSGIGPADQLKKFNISVVVDSPGVGENVQDRTEAAIVWKLKNTHKLFQAGCIFGDDPAKDPCLAEWLATNHTNIYSAGPAIWGNAYKSSPNLPYLDMWSMWGPGAFTTYYRGYPAVLGATAPTSLNNVLLKAHAKSKGWVRLTGSNPQDKLEVNKNYLGNADSVKDFEILRDAIKKSRKFIADTPQINQWIVEETWPGSKYQTDAQLWEFLRANVFGHHLCCSAKMGSDSDKSAVLNSQFQVRGVKNLRVVDNSVWPDIPGMFVTTPIYTISEKAADSVLATAKANGWAPSP